jgi:hypothetical protein
MQKNSCGVQYFLAFRELDAGLFHHDQLPGSVNKSGLRRYQHAQCSYAGRSKDPFIRTNRTVPDYNPYFFELLLCQEIGMVSPDFHEVEFASFRHIHKPSSPKLTLNVWARPKPSIGELFLDLAVGVEM